MHDAAAEVTCLVSIGTGRGTFKYTRPGFLEKLMPNGIKAMKEAAKMCVAITMDCHKEHLKVHQMYVESSSPIVHVSHFTKGLKKQVDRMLNIDLMSTWVLRQLA